MTVLVVIFCAAFSMLAASASAARLKAGSFSEGGTGAGRLNQPGGIAVGPDGNHVFIADTGNQRIDEFTASGEFVRAWGWGVKDGSEELQTCTAATGCGIGLTGLGPGQLNEPIGVAVDAAGDVYAVDRARKDGRIQRFDVSAEEVAYDGALPAGYAGGPGTVEFSYPLPSTNDIAIGSDGTVYVADNNAVEGPRVVAFDPVTGTSEPIAVSVASIGAIGFAAEETATGPRERLYVGGQFGEVAVIEGGAETNRFEPGLPQITALAFDPRSGNVFVEGPVETSEEALVENVRELSPQGEVLGAIRVETAGPGESQPNAYGLAVDPSVALEGEFEPGAIFVTRPYQRYSFEARVFVFGEPTPGPPQILSANAVPLGTDGVNFGAAVTPRGSDTHVYFEYGPTTAYGSVAPPSPGTDIGAGFGAIQVGAQVSGLRPGTVYHYAVVATNSSGTKVSPDRTFATFGPATPFALPDERVWEQVTTEKGTGIISGPGGFGLSVAEPEGGAIAFSDIGPLPGTQSSFLTSAYAVFRSPTGWQTEPVSLPGRSTSIQTGDQIRTLSGDLTKSVASTDRALTPDAPPGNNLYLRDDRSGAVTLLTPELSGTSRNPNGNIGAALGSTDLSRIIFSTSYRLTPDTPEEDGSPYLYEYSDGGVRDVGVLPGASTPTHANLEGGYRPPPGSVSSDGGRVFFGAVPAEGEGRQVFVRLDSTRTVEVSAPRRSTPEDEAAEQPATFVGASTDGRYAFFTSSAELTEDANTGERPAAGEGEQALKEAPNLYRYDVDREELIDLSVDTSAEDTERGANVIGEVVISPDGRSAYFLAAGSLVPGATSGRQNLYRWSEAGGVEYVAVLDAGGLGVASSRTDTTGSVLFFPQQKPLDPSYPETTANEIYRYSSASRSITCVSCAPAAPLTAQTELVGGPHVLSTDGRRFFFQSAEPLVTDDTNGKTDVYEWENGTLHLISSGTARQDAKLLDASADGDDVFFTTVDRLVASDTDDQSDIYDARVRGGFPAPAPSPAPCEGEGCRAPLEAAPAAAPGGSRPFNGPADPRHKRHAKRKKRRHRKHHRHRVKPGKHDRSHTHAAAGKRG